MRVAKQAPQEEITLNMTPMIDVVFLLIIFFVTVAKLSEAETAAKLELPVADQANPEENLEMDRLIISVLSDGTLDILGEKIRLDDPSDSERFRRILKAEASKSVDAQGYATKPIVIRGDRLTPYSYVQEIMRLCRDAGIWKLSFAAEREEKK